MHSIYCIKLDLTFQNFRIECLIVSTILGRMVATTSVGISEKLHFPTCSCDRDLELAFLVFTNFGAFIQYLTE